MNKAKVIGGGLAGCEAAFKLAESGISVELFEMKPLKHSPAHKTDMLAELVCSNSLKASRTDSAAGLLKQEMRMLGSVCLKAADTCSLPAGGALAVDRDDFSSFITEAVSRHPNITVKHEVVSEIDENVTIVIATGPLTDSLLADKLEAYFGEKSLSFYDAAAPIVEKSSIDFSKAFFASRYREDEDGDYINCPLNKEEYERFYGELINAETAPLHSFDKQLKVYEGCMPIETLAKRGTDSIRFGPLKPVGLRDPRTGHRPWAVVQLRRDNSSDTLYNMVGFQTNLKFPEQKRVFSMIPGLENAELIRYGVMHRNTFINSPRLINKNLSAIKNNALFVAGQLSGVEGYMESAACGIAAGINAANYILGKKPLILPEFTMIGALLNYITNPTVVDFQPMGANFGIMPPLSEHIRDKRERYAAFSSRSLEWYKNNPELYNITITKE